MYTTKMIYFISVLSLLFCLPVYAQVATLRMNFDDDVFPGAMRPKEFSVNRTGSIPWSNKTSGETVSLGDFLTRQGARPENMEKKLDIDGGLHGRSSTTLSASADPSTLYLVIQCNEPFPGKMTKKLDTYFPDDRIDVFLDMNHDHYSFTRISVMPDGYSEQTSYRVRENHLNWDQNHSKTDDKLDFSSTCSRNERGWTLNLDVRLPPRSNEDRSDASWRVIGLNVVRYRSVGGEEVTMWCPDYNRVAAPMYFGDLYLGDPPVMVSSVALGTVCRGLNEGKLTFKKSTKGLEIEAGSYNHLGLFSSEKFHAEMTKCNFLWTFDPRDILFGSLLLKINGVLWGSYEFGWSRGLLMTLDPGMDEGVSASKKPSPGEKDYYWKYSRYILDRLPEFNRTQDGLGLKTSSGLFIDLKNSSSALDKLAQIIMETFHSEEERIVGAALLLCQEGLMVSSGTGERLSQRFGGPGILRIGAAFCSSYSELLRDVVNRMKDDRGNSFRACVVNCKRGPADTFGWPNHWVVGVAYHSGITIIDAELGLFFIQPDNGRLVTLQQLIERPELAEQTAYGFSEYFLKRPIEDFHVREYGDLWNEWLK